MVKNRFLIERERERGTPWKIRQYGTRDWEEVGPDFPISSLRRKCVEAGKNTGSGFSEVGKGIFTRSRHVCQFVA